MPKAPLTVLRTTLSLEEISTALRISPADAIAKFQDARVTSWFAEIWGERLFNYTKHVSANQPGSDAAIALGDIGRFDIGVRCFFRNTIKFQKSKFIGSGRTANKEDLIASLEEIERYVIVDLRKFPTLSFYPLDTKSLLRLVHLGKLTVTGITPTRFDAWVSDTFAVTVKDFIL
jgi:hypothetical protein